MSTTSSCTECRHGIHKVFCRHNYLAGFAFLSGIHQHETVVHDAAVDEASKHGVKPKQIRCGAEHDDYLSGTRLGHFATKTIQKAHGSLVVSPQREQQNDV